MFVFNCTKYYYLILDGTMKFWESDKGKFVASMRPHKGWVTDLLFVQRKKILFSCSQDGCIIVWGSGGNILEKLNVSLLWFCYFKCIVNLYLQK